MGKIIDIPTPDLLDYFEEMCDDGDKDYCNALDAYYSGKATSLPEFEKVGTKTNISSAPNDDKPNKRKAIIHVIFWAIMLLILLAIWYKKFYKKAEK